MSTIVKFYKTFFLFILFASSAIAQHYNVDIAETGESTLFIFQDSIDGLDVGDELGLFDSNGILDSNGNTGEILVGAGVWTGSQIEVVAIGAVNLSEFGGPILPGAIGGNTMSLKIWKASEELEYEATYTTDSGSGSFNGLFTAIDSISLEAGCADDDSALAGFGGCAGAVAALGCDFVFSGIPISDSCPETCGECPVYGCTDSAADNYNPDANTDDGSCEYPACADDDSAVEGFGGCAAAVVALGCDFVFGGSPISELCPETCGECDDDCESGIFDCAGVCDGAAVEDCAGECGGSAVEDECGVCDGDGASDTCWNGDLVCDLSECSDQPVNYPDWDLNGDGVLDNYNDYENNGSITARVYEDGLNLTGSGDLIAGFVNSDQRGVGVATVVPEFLGGGYAFLMMIYSNESSGENISFKYYSALNDEIFDIGTTVEFENNMTLGDVTNPYVLEIMTDIDVVLDLSGGWNWLSLNVFSDDMSLNNVLYGLEPGSATYIKSITAFADYYEGYGWYGQLSQFGISNTEMYKLYLVYDEALEFTGAPVDVADTPIILSTGWNWIGYTPQVSYSTNYALSGIGADNATYIKGQAGFADYYTGYGWYGQLSDMNPFYGYQIYMVNDDQFTYPSDGLLSSNFIDNKNNIVDNFIVDVNPHDYEFNGSATIEVVVDGNKINNTDYSLAAFNGDQCVGITKPYKFPLNDLYVFGLMMYSNEENAFLSFKLYDENKNEYIDLDQKIDFISDMHLGDGLNPIVMTSTVNVPNEFDISAAYPNPFNPIVNFDISLSSDTFISASVFNISGQKIANIYEGSLNSGMSTISWNAMGFASGIYFINIESNNGLLSSQKISLLK